jgi:acyl-CoA synthetase (AMP-forming)/AMP-acid ligase II
MYADAKFLFRHDITHGALVPISTAAAKFTEERFRASRALIYHDFENWATNPKTADNIFLIFEDRSWTYLQFYEQIGRVGNWLIQEYDIQRGEIVALNGGNSPEYLMLWFGLEVIGANPAFINCNLTKEPLTHCVTLCDCRYLLADSDIRHLVEPSTNKLASHNCKIVYYNQELLSSLNTYSTVPPRSRYVGVLPTDNSCLLYTSGTTGLPKATILSRARELNTGRGTALYLGLSQKSKYQPDKSPDRIYTCLPLYHGAGHGLAVTPAVHAGTTIILARKFSHNTFWPEVHASRANIVQYVGELARYLVNVPPRADKLDVTHNVHQAWGNGMRADVWEKFRSRFRVPIINELYAATDGLGACFNYNGGPFGANSIAKRGLLWKVLNGKNEKRVRMDPDTEEIVRDPETGFAIECEVGEPGQAMYRMVDAARAATFLKGYYGNPTASAKRWTSDLFEKGDKWFMSGDMHRQNADGTVAFVDRLGDTFRWKSENVSTNEVADIFGQHPQIAETTVVGVEVPHADGRCGLAVVVPREGLTETSLDWRGLARHATGTLPRYAVPIFVRVVKGLEVTGTRKRGLHCLTVDEIGLINSL